MLPRREQSTKNPASRAPRSAYRWTAHAQMKMRRYRLSESAVKRIVRWPARTEEGVIHDAVAAMRPAQSGNGEAWTMYRAENGVITVITAWRYPGKSPVRNPIPKEILEEARNIIFG